MSVTRIIRLSALESSLRRVDLWWRGLSSRERWLVGGLGALLLAVILVFGIVKPLQAARAQALADIRTYETLTARVRAAGTLAPVGAQPQPRPGAPIDAAGASAREAGIVATFTPGAAGGSAQVAEAPYEAVLGWIADVEQTTSLRATRVEMRKGNAPGRVSATVEWSQ